MGKSKKYRGWAEAPSVLNGKIIDNHTHLPVHENQIPRREGLRLSLSEQLNRAAQVGIQALITSACELPEWLPSMELANTYRGVWVALAIHPNEAALHAGISELAPDGNCYEPAPHHREYDLEQAMSVLENIFKSAKASKRESCPDYALEQDSRLDIASKRDFCLEKAARGNICLSAAEKLIAVGETGLDYFRTGEAGKQAQISSFRSHIALAKELNLPLQIHDRDAHADTIKYLQQDLAPEVTIFHCYSGDREMSEVLARQGWYASIAGPISYPANQWQREALAALPRELVLVETDAPYLTPHPHRGQPNASYLLPWTLRYIAELWDVSEAEACAQIGANMRRAYGEKIFQESLGENVF